MTSANALCRLRAAWLRLAGPRQRAGLALLALLLVQAQGLGLWHRVAHGGLPAGAAAMSAEAPHVLQAPRDAHHEAHDHAHDGHHAHHGAHGLFGHDAGDDSGCRLFDQMAAADALLAASALAADEAPPPGGDLCGAFALRRPRAAALPGPRSAPGLKRLTASP